MKAILFLLLAAILSAAGVPDEQARGPQRVMSPARVDGVNDVAAFGPGAAEVWIYDRRGRRVFHAAKQGAPIVWDCKDPSGRVREAGVYVARIRKTDAGVIYQSFALVK